ncbi:MAG: hypothetical protein Roseis2KO_49870 [Roseivirga sp.]
MSHFSIGYQPEEENGSMFTVVFSRENTPPLTNKQPTDIRKLTKSYLRLITWVATAPAGGLMK